MRLTARCPSKKQRPSHLRCGISCHKRRAAAVAPLRAILRGILNEVDPQFCFCSRAVWSCHFLEVGDSLGVGVQLVGCVCIGLKVQLRSSNKTLISRSVLRIRTPNSKLTEPSEVALISGALDSCQVCILRIVS